MQRNTLLAILLLVVIWSVSLVGAIYLGSNAKRTLIVSTTTSLYDSALLDAIEDDFESRYPVDLYFISVGTGLAITHAQRGDADLILVHAPSKEQVFLEGGYGYCRKIIAYNFFALVGPEDDPARIEGLSPTSALSSIVHVGRSGGVKWISRGDDSGTHTQEKTLWTAAGFNWTQLRNEAWFIEATAGMGKTLQVADNFDAYTLADTGTFLKYSKDELITLAALVTQGEELLNAYSAIAGNSTKYPHINFDDAILFIKYLTSGAGQELIANFDQDKYGTPLFYPAIPLLEQNTDPTLARWLKNYAFIEGYECPPQYWDAHPELYS